MRGKVMLAAAMLLAWNSDCFAVNAESQSAITSSEAMAVSLLPLPSMTIRSELTQQLMEVAIAGIHPEFAKSWLELTNHPDLAKKPETYFQMYSLLHQFRHQWHALDADSRERFHLKKFNPVFSDSERKEYIALMQSADSELMINKLRPQTENYLVSRKMLLSLLNQSRLAAWPDLPDVKVKPGEANDALPLIRSALLRSGDLPDGELDADQLKLTAYDDQTAMAIRAFQQRHGLESDGVIGRRTLSWLRLPPQVRAVILARSILRSDLPLQISAQRHVLVNIPEFQLRVFDGQQVIFSSRVIVGQEKRQTPILSSQISSIVLNPAWHVPARILQQDLVPKLIKDKHFLDKGQFELIDSQGMTVDPTAMVWDGTEDNFPYRLRQKPGDHNALGRYKFYLPNNDAIYLHSTSSPAYFKRDLRALSSGCVRVEEADDFAKLLLKGSKWNVSKLDDMLKEETTKWLPMTDPVPVYTVYWRSWVDKQGKLQLRDDIYHFDDDAKMANNAVMTSLMDHS